MSYRLIIKGTNGNTLVKAEGFNPTDVRSHHTRISRNPEVIDRIELHDGEGCLETIWSKDWT